VALMAQHKVPATEVGAAAAVRTMVVPYRWLVAPVDAEDPCTRSAATATIRPHAFENAAPLPRVRRQGRPRRGLAEGGLAPQEGIAL
jgi:hypothetical protein